MRTFVLVSLITLVASTVHAGKFGGFSADQTRYLDGKNAVCAPVAVDAEGKPLDAPVCADEDAATVKGRKFVGPPRLKPAKSAAKGAVELVVSHEGATLTVSGDAGNGFKPLAVWDAPADITATRGPWLSPDGHTVVVELTTTASKTAAITIGFDVRVTLAAVAPRPGGVADRVKKRGSTWTQRLIPCEQAGVTFVFKDRQANITIETRCQGDRDKLRVGGRYRFEEPDKLVVVFANQDGPDEELACQVESCEDDRSLECLRCVSDDVSFVVKPAK